MPLKSKSQARFMGAVVAGKVKGKNAPTKAQAREFFAATPTLKGLPERAKRGRKKG